ncbi:hypothetical protein BGZ61DRAFT_590163 [Ilyonectria robusta]|uniref:uncharacterized protein n=1 Tax=Ilyonectria robusta TaxID=1079257 RepID=UPI001E8E8CC3|nr:uncharacterized protein BGZ61DRAFT_590163 [Ilyonectria robusta]KAH8684079.1 hypothetical protein BGZ61DRAFT_590163 [Ilyonectria robusta]
MPQPSPPSPPGRQLPDHVSDISTSAQTGIDGSSVSASRGAKRCAPTAANASYPRKRALYACQVCRRRKSKCDNAQPKCGFCASVGAACTYESTSQALSSYDAGNHILLERINYVVSLLEAKSNNSTGYNFHPTSALGQCQSSTLERLTDPDINGASENRQSIPPWSVTCRILRWPIFGEDEWSTSLKSLFVPGTGTAAKSSLRQHGIIEEDLPSHIRSFLANVHTKNPVVDHKTLVQYARDAAENGLAWDGPSCMVLIASALGIASESFRRIPTSQPRSAESNLALADIYYTGARKRIGLLRNDSLLCLQCNFLSGVYEMYRLRPLDAWHSFDSACNLMQLYFRTRNPDMISTETKDLEERLYWSCSKSEIELRMEIDLFPMRSSGLPTSANFPSPPNDDAQTPEEFPVQESWYYYLSEISQKHTVDRIIDTFYAVSDDTELLRLPLPPKIQIASELEQHELLAASTLPDWLRFRGEADDREIPWVLHSRALIYEEADNSSQA